VWSINTSALGGAHIASFPEDLVVPCVLASTKPDEVVFDPFFGSGTVGVVAGQLGRRYVGIELNPEYVRVAQRALTVPGNGRRRSSVRYPEHKHELWNSRDRLVSLVGIRTPAP
jgi:DNA modification methylase